jgi:membrane protein
VSLVFGTLGLHDSVDWAVNRLWQCTVGRSFWLNKLRGVLVIFWAAGLAVLTLASTSLWSLVLNAAHVEGIGELGWLTLLPSYALDVAIFTALYRLTPIVSVRNRPAFAGGVLGATLWEVSKVVFGWWVLQVGTYNRVYGPLAASIVVMLWLWVSSAVFLFGAGLSASIQRRWEAQEKGHHPVAPG